MQLYLTDHMAYKSAADSDCLSALTYFCSMDAVHASMTNWYNLLCAEDAAI